MLTHTYDMRVRVINKERALLPGMVAEVTIPATPAAASTAHVALPLTAVQQRADGTLFVWTINADSTAHRTPVSVGQSIGGRIEVTTGLDNSQRVVTEGYQKLSEGTKVIF